MLLSDSAPEPRRPAVRTVVAVSGATLLGILGASALLVATLAFQVVDRGRYPVFDSAPGAFLVEWARVGAAAALPWAAALAVVALGLGLLLRRLRTGRRLRSWLLAMPSVAGLLLVAWASDGLRTKVEDDRPVDGFLPEPRVYGAAGEAAAANDAGSSHSARPDLVLVTIDTLRADHLGHLGYGRDTSPVIDRLAARGVSFAQAAAPAPMTQPSIAALMTGQPVHAIHPHLSTEPRQAGAFVRDGFQLLAERLRDAGYQTAGFIANRHLKRDNGYAQGFQIFDEVSGMYGSTEEGRRKHSGHVVDAALRWLRARGSDPRPVFLWMHVLDPHQPYEPAEPGPWEDVGSETFQAYRAQYEAWSVPELSNHLKAMMAGDSSLREGELEFLVGRYDAEILQVDRHLGRFLEGWSDAGHDVEDSLVVITSDHGEEFYDHGGFLHSHTLFDELIRVPLVLAGPGFRGGRRVDGQVSLLDVAPTMLRAAGVPIGPGSALAGRPLQASSVRGTGPALAYLKRKRMALRTADHKLVGEWRIVEPGCPSGDPWSDLERLYRARYVADRHWPKQRVGVKIFDLAGDPGERMTLDDPWQRHRMLCAYGNALRSLPPLDVGLAGEAGLSEEDKDDLRALGYVVD